MAALGLLGLLGTKSPAYIRFLGRVLNSKTIKASVPIIKKKVFLIGFKKLQPSGGGF